MYAFLDFFFLVSHTGLIVFILLGWGWPRVRRLHLLVSVLTWISWIGLGFFYGFGYCFCTDWHWQIKRRLGAVDLPNSFVKYILDGLTGLDWAPLVVDGAVLLGGLGALLASLWLNGRDWRR